jgi:hypothetical protein
MDDRAPVTSRVAAFISGFSAEALPPPVFDYIRLLAYDGIGTLFAATHPSVTASRGIGDFAVANGGKGGATLIGRAVTTDPVTANPLKGHSAQYILPVRAARRRLSYVDLFEDRRDTDPEVARLAAGATVVRDRGEFDKRFPEFYVGEVTLTLADGRTVRERCDVARGYPEMPLPREDIDRKFNEIVGGVADTARREALAEAADGLHDAASVTRLAALLADPPGPCSA